MRSGPQDSLTGNLAEKLKMEQQRDIKRDANEAKCRRSAGNGDGVATSDHRRGKGSLHRRVSVFGAAGAILFALSGLLGYVPSLGLLGSFGEGYIPMAPSTAISAIVLGGILLAMALRPLSGASVILFGTLAALVSLFGSLEVAGHLTGRDLNFEDSLVPAAGHLGDIPIARMSPATGATYFLAGLAVLALLLRRSRPHGRGTGLGHWGGSLGTLVLGISVFSCLAYLHGSPLLYGRGDTIPMALTTALAFLMLGAATVGVSGKGALPLNLFAGAKRAGKPMSARRRFVSLTLIMVGACAMVMTVMTGILYRRNIEEHREQLQATARSQVRLIEAIARYDARVADVIREEDPDYDASAATLSQIADAHERYEGFGETGEFTLARRNGDSIVYVLRHRHDTVERPAPVGFDSGLAEPMRRALEGMSGTVIGLDYRGETVLAAHEPVAVLNLGIVAKIDLAEIRRPFIRSCLVAGVAAFLVVLAGTALFLWIGNPLLARVEAYARDLEEEITERKQAEEGLRQYEHIVSSTTDMLALLDKDYVYLSANAAYVEAFAKASGEVIGRTAPEIFGEKFFNAAIRPRAEACLAGKNIRYQDWFDFPGTGRLYMDVAYFPYRRADTEVLGFVVAARDITERKQIEEELVKHRYHLEELVEQRTAELTAANKELESFSYSVSHDLRTPLRGLVGFSQALLEEYADKVDERGKHYLSRIAAAGGRMAELIDDLLGLLGVTRSEMRRERVDLSEAARGVAAALREGQADRSVEFVIADGSVVTGDKRLLGTVLENLLGNAWKFTSGHPTATIQFGVTDIENERVYFVRDDGAGFDMGYADKLFGAFQRLHTEEEFPGTGIGLATVQRIVRRHGGRLWAEGEVEKGATFYFTLPATAQPDETAASEPSKREETVLAP